jgi:hypothetical protein
MKQLILSADQLDQICDWLQHLTLAQVVHRMAQPSPEGFGIQTSRAALSRLTNRFKLEKILDENQDFKAWAAELTAQNQANPAPYQQAAVGIMEQRVFLEAIELKSPGAFKRVTNWLLRRETHSMKIEQLKIARARLALQREKFEFSVSKAALPTLPALPEIAVDEPLDACRKIEAGRVKLFTSASEPTEPTPSIQPPLAFPTEHSLPAQPLAC